MSNDVIVQENTTMSLVMNTDIKQVSQQLQAIENFQTVVQQTLRKDQDFGVIPGTHKPTLLKPGAEKILMLMGLTSEYEIADKVEDFQNGFFSYTIKASLKKGDQLITEGFGSANTRETRYQLKEWDDVERKKVWRGEFQDPYTLNNTVLKMAKKRAQVDAALTVGSLSNVFTQDIEDMKDFLDKEQLETMNDGDAGSMRVTFGKYKGKTLSELLIEDRSYVEWLSEKAKEEAMKQAALMVLKGESKPVANAADNPQQDLLTANQLAEIEMLADAISKERNVSLEEVFKAYKAINYKQFNQNTADGFINTMKLHLEKTKAAQTKLFDDVNPPMEGTTYDGDLPFPDVE